MQIPALLEIKIVFRFFNVVYDIMPQDMLEYFHPPTGLCRSRNLWEDENSLISHSVEQCQ